MPRAEVERVQLDQGLGADQAAAVARAIEPPVVHADQMTVPGQPDVALQPVGAVLHRAEVGAERVLRQRVAPAAVCEDEWTMVAHSTRAGCPFSLMTSR